MVIYLIREIGPFSRNTRTIFKEGQDKKNIKPEEQKDMFDMFVVIINFPPIKAGKDSDFLEWFASTNKTFANYKGFVGRRLLKPVKGGNYSAIVEHESQETFLAMHNSPAHDDASKGLGALFDGHPSPEFFEVIIG